MSLESSTTSSQSYIRGSALTSAVVGANHTGTQHVSKDHKLVVRASKPHHEAQGLRPSPSAPAAFCDAFIQLLLLHWGQNLVTQLATKNSEASVVG